MNPKGIFLSRTGIIAALLGFFVMLPKILVKVEMESWFTHWFANPYSAFIIIMVIGICAYNYRFWGNKVLFLILLILIAIISYFYVWALYL